MTASTPPCPHRPPCPGCPHYGEPLSEQPALSRLQALSGAAGCALERLTGPQVGYRARARLAVRGRPGAPKLGIFQRGSHRIVDIPHCVVHHPALNAVAQRVRQVLVATRTAPYADVPHRGLVRYLQLMVDPGDGRCQLVVVCNAATVDSARPLLTAIERDLGPRLHSLAWNGQPARSNAIIGPHWEHIAGPPALQQTIAGAAVFFPPSAFAQNNPTTYAAIVHWVQARVPAGARVVEYYAGVGAMGLGLSPHAESVAFNEIAPGSLLGLSMGLQGLPASLRARTTVHAGSAVEHLGLLQHADVVIVDPPRRGLDAALCSALTARPAARLLYVSCGLDSFERDARALRAAGYRLQALAVADLFPFTGHVETVAHFEPPARTAAGSAT